MKIRTVLAIVFVFSISYSPTLAQLGPEDGAKLAPTDLDRIKVGQPAPDFSLENIDGKKVALSDFRGKKSVVLVFYRGHW